MKIDHRGTGRSMAAGTKQTRRCSICGRKVTAPQKSLSMEGKEICEICYCESFFADSGASCHPLLDRHDA